MAMDKKELYRWCSIPAGELENQPDLKIPLRIVRDSDEMGRAMARDFADEIIAANADGRLFRAIVPCGPKAWYSPFAEIINSERISLHNMTVFHMDECLDWQGRLLAKNDPYNFRTFMEDFFYGPITQELNVAEDNRVFPEPGKIDQIRERINEAPLDLTLGGWGQDGHIAYNQSRRHPYSAVTVEELYNSTIRIQDNNLDTIIALSERTYGAGYQFVPPMSITLGLKECLSAKKVRLYSDTGSWKQTALRVALFSGITTEYPITLLQTHPDALLTASYATADHPISRHPGWQFTGVNV